MSYASIAAHNAPPESEQPRPDPNLLEGHNSTGEVNTHLPDVDSGKVNVIPSDADLEHLKTESQEAYEKAVAAAREQRAQLERDAANAKRSAEKTAREAGDAADKTARDAKAYAKQAGDKAQKFAHDAREELDKDTRELRRRAKEEGKKLKKAAGEAGEEIESFWNSFSSDPKQWGPALAALNVALLGGLGAYAYTNREQVQRADRRLISAVAVGVLGLIGGQGYWAQETARKQSGRK